jgi:hypothetical protein
MSKVNPNDYKTIDSSTSLKWKFYYFDQSGNDITKEFYELNKSIVNRVEDEVAIQSREHKCISNILDIILDDEYNIVKVTDKKLE